jgi:CheY-like chemotaxis protein
VRLAQVLSNLLSNACKYTEPGGRISLSAQCEGGDVAISVRDNGIGIAADMLPNVFEMFAQASGGSDRSQGGLGIGLTLVRRLVELHGGTVVARSAGLGLGSEFTVRLPILSERPVSQPPPEAPRTEMIPRRRILVVDDNRDAAESLATLLGLTGHETRVAHDGSEAVEAAEAFRPDVVLLDIGLPKMSGHDAARCIRERPWGKGMVLVALTGWGQEHDRRRSQEVGFDHHLVKPVDPAALMRLIASQATPDASPAEPD